jgi:hypothetical protein
LLVLNIDSIQYRLVGDRGGLHAGRRVVPGATTGEPVLLVLWSDVATGAGVRVTSRSAAALAHRSGVGYAERDVFVGSGPRVTVFGPEQHVVVDVEHRRVSYRRGPDRISLAGGPVYRGAGAYADWRLAFVKPLA